MNAPSTIELRGSGASWAGYRGSERVTPYRNRPEQITALIDKLNRKAAASTRPCLCCGARFNSEGPHNRMCGTCRSRASGMV